MTVSDTNNAIVEDLFHKYVGEKASAGKYSAAWKKARGQIQESPEMRAELVAKLKTLV